MGAESARWLLTQGGLEEAHRYLLGCARLNGRPVGEDSLSQEVRVNVCECMQVHVCAWPVSSTLFWDPLCVQEKLLALV